MIVWMGGLPSLVRAAPGSPEPFWVFIDEGTPHARTLVTWLKELSNRNGAGFLDVTEHRAPSSTASLLAQAITEYEATNYAAGQRTCQMALDQARKTGAEGLASHLLTDVYVYGALCASELGDAALAWEHWLQAARLHPNRVLDPVRFSPRVVETFERAKQAISSQPRSELHFDVPVSCQLWLDGDQVSLRDFQVPVGEHFARTQCPNLEDWGGAVVVNNLAQTVKPPWRQKKRSSDSWLRSSFGTGENQTVAIFRGIAVSPQSSSLIMRVYDPHGRLVRTAAINIDPPKRESLSQLLATMQPTSSSSDIAPTPWYHNRWLWAAAGVIATTAIFVPVLLNREDGNDGFSVSLTGDLP